MATISIRVPDDDLAVQMADDESLRMSVRVTPDQLREINRRARLEPWDGKARSEYVVGCVFNEPHDKLLERVREIRDAERAKLRAEIQVDREAREKQRAPRRRALHPRPA